MWWDPSNGEKVENPSTSKDVSTPENVTESAEFSYLDRVWPSDIQKNADFMAESENSGKMTVGRPNYRHLPPRKTQVPVDNFRGVQTSMLKDDSLQKSDRNFENLPINSWPE